MPVGNKLDQWEEAGQVLREFSRACRQSNSGYAYEAGWMTTTVQRLLMSLPPEQFETELDMLRSQTRQLEATAIVAKLTG